MTDNKGSPDFPTRRETEEPRFCDSQRSFTVSLAAVIHVSHEPLLICPAFEPLFPPLLKPLQTMLKTQDILIEEPARAWPSRRRLHCEKMRHPDSARLHCKKLWNPDSAERQRPALCN